MENQPAAIFEGITIGIGTWAWGDKSFWGYGKNFGEEDVKEAFDASLQCGIRFFDTAEIYGMGKSEELLGRFLKGTDSKPIIATKFMPFPWKMDRNSLLKALENSLHRLQLPQVDLYQMHWAFPPVAIENWMKSMVVAVDRGWTKAVGVSNYNLKQTMQAHNALKLAGIPLASNQVEYHLLNRKIEKNGLLRECQQSGITIISYSPLAQGILTGKYTPENLPPGVRRYRTSRDYLKKVQPMIALLNRIGESNGGKTAAQVAINWTICKGTIPIPGVKNCHQVENNLGALGWRLSEEEVAILDEMSDRVTQR